MSNGIESQKNIFLLVSKLIYLKIFIYIYIYIYIYVYKYMRVF